MSGTRGTRIYLDTETNGKHPLRRAWEIALIICTPGQALKELLLYVDIRDIDVKGAEPGAFQIGRFDERHPQRNGVLPDGARLVRETQLARLVYEVTRGAQIHGVVPSFDTDTLAPALRRHHREPGWHYMPLCVSTMAAGYLNALNISPKQTSEEISRQCGVEPPEGDERHTALGDARWAHRWHHHLLSRRAPMRLDPNYVHLAGADRIVRAGQRDMSQQRVTLRRTAVKAADRNDA